MRFGSVFEHVIFGNFLELSDFWRALRCPPGVPDNFWTYRFLFFYTCIIHHHHHPSSITPLPSSICHHHLPSSSISLVVLLVAFIGAEGLYNFAEVDAVAALMFALVLTIGSMLDRSGRHEWNSALTFSAIGFWLAIAAAGSAMGDLPSTFERESGQLVSTLNLERQATLYVFFAYWTMATAAGLLAGVMSRGVLHPAGHDGWFSFMGYHEGFNRKALPLMIALGVWVLAFAGSLWHFNSVGVVDQLGITDEAGYHGYSS